MCQSAILLEQIFNAALEVLSNDFDCDYYNYSMVHLFHNFFEVLYDYQKNYVVPFMACVPVVCYP